MMDMRTHFYFHAESLNKALSHLTGGRIQKLDQFFDVIIGNAGYANYNNAQVRYSGYDKVEIASKTMTFNGSPVKAALGNQFRDQLSDASHEGVYGLSKYQLSGLDNGISARLTSITRNRKRTDTYLLSIGDWRALTEQQREELSAYLDNMSEIGIRADHPLTKQKDAESLLMVKAYLSDDMPPVIFKETKIVETEHPLFKSIDANAIRFMQNRKGERSSGNTKKNNGSTGNNILPKITTIPALPDKDDVKRTGTPFKMMYAGDYSSAAKLVAAAVLYENAEMNFRLIDLARTINPGKNHGSFHSPAMELMDMNYFVSADDGRYSLNLLPETMTRDVFLDIVKDFHVMPADMRQQIVLKQQAQENYDPADKDGSYGMNLKFGM